LQAPARASHDAGRRMFPITLLYLLAVGTRYHSSFVVTSFNLSLPTVPLSDFRHELVEVQGGENGRAGHSTITMGGSIFM
jgi:hypothetical protein